MIRPDRIPDVLVPTTDQLTKRDPSSADLSTCQPQCGAGTIARRKSSTTQLLGSPNLYNAQRLSFLILVLPMKSLV